MFIQRSILNYENKTESLFIRKADNLISFDTFFNSLNVYLIKKYTDGKNVSLTFSYKGKAHLKIVYKSLASEKELLDSELSKNEYSVNIEDLPSEGIIYPVFSSLDGFELDGFNYEVDSTSRDIKPAIVICTYKREDYLLKNLKELEQCKDYISQVIVVDNGQSVELDDSFSKKYITFITNKNVGGTGGFTRGMIEAKKKGYTHIFVMDDDITLLPEVVNKTVSFISCLKDEYKEGWLGYSMLPNSNPTMQYELGTTWNGVRMRLNNRGLDLTSVDNVLHNQINNNYNYSAWWSLIMPTTVLDKYGYPFPFFIKFDDIEYGLRRKDEGIILTNGFAVWHQDFDEKLHPSLEYYLYRNALVTNALHDSRPLWHSIIRFMGKKVKFYFKLKPREMEMMDLGINDFLKGPDYFLNLDIQKRHKEIRELSSKKPNYLKGIFVSPFISFYYCVKLAKKFKKARVLYVNSFKTVTSFEYWNGVFNDEK